MSSADPSTLRFGNYGTPKGSAHHLYAQSLDALHSHCEWKYEDVSKIFPSFIMNHFKDNARYDAFNGTDYTPHNLHTYPDHSHWRKGLTARPAGSAPTVGALCEFESADRGGLNWALMRVGPFTSNGGYDWWQYAGHDALKLSRHLRERGTIAIASHYVTGVEVASGKPLGYPPLHVHHIHLVPEKPWLRYQWWTPVTASWRNMLEMVRTTQGAAYYVPNYVMEQHGEWDVCDIHEEGEGCFAEALPAGYGNVIDFSLDLEGEINDGRRPGAEDLTWWLEVGVGWTDTEAVKPLSYAVLVEDHFGLVDGHQSTYENYHFVPSRGEWVHYYAGRMPTGGRLVRMKHHVHMNLLQKSYFLGGVAAEELELRARPLGPDGREMGPKEVPASFYSNFGLFGKTERALIDWPVGVVSPQQLGAADLADFELQLLARVGALRGGHEHIICTLTRGDRRVDGYLWDRAGRSVCAEWAFAPGERFTSVSLLHYHGERLPFAPGWDPAAEVRRLPSHNQWNLYFESSDGAAHYFVYSALIHDRSRRLMRHVIRELLLMMNWRVVAPEHAPLGTHLFARWLSVRRLAPLTLALLLAACVALPVVGWRCARKRKGD